MASLGARAIQKLPVRMRTGASYVEGKNPIFDHLSADGDPGRLAAMAEEPFSRLLVPLA